MDAWRRLLPRYYDILEDQGTAQYLDCKQVQVSFDPSTPLAGLWGIHDSALEHLKIQDTPPSQSLLDLKIEIAQRIYQSCCLCEHHCNINREKMTGKCGVRDSRIASEFLHTGEEPPLIPSHTIFFSGCTFQCVFCQNWDISQYQNGAGVSPKNLAERITQRKQQGARNVNWVGGEPTSNLPFILRVLRELRINRPQVWNSNMFCSEQTMKLLHGVIDVYLTDFKYGNDACAQRLSKVNGYVSVVKQNHLIASQQGEVMIRHLVLPNHSVCCSQLILEWIRRNIPDVLVNVMGQYRPYYQAQDYEDIADVLPRDEYYRVTEYAKRLGLSLI